MSAEPLEQMSFVAPLLPSALIAAARAEHNPIASVCLFSGGHDSCVLAHHCRDDYDELAFIDTGTAAPGVIEFVQSYAEWIDKPLRIVSAGDAFRRMVLGDDDEIGHGFPGPGQHYKAYTRLKERQIEALLRDLKMGHPRSARVMFLTGVRRAESARRATRMPITRRGGIVFVNPLIDWTDAAMWRYRREHDIPESDVAALLHRSGECNCGSFAAPGEREDLIAFFPEWFEATIGSLEREAAENGIANCRWGERPGEAPETTGELCSDCQLRLAA